MQNNFNKKSSAIFILTTVFYFFFLCSCEQKPAQIDTGLNDKLNFNPTEYQEKLRASLSNGDSSVMNSSMIEYFDTLEQVYSNREFKPLFIRSFEEKPFVDSLLNILEKANEHGLNPERYNFTRIKEEYSNSIEDNLESAERYQRLVNTELLVCDAVLKYSYHMRFGVLNPNKLFLDSYYLPVTDSSKRDLLQPLAQANIIQYLTDVQPKSKRYKQLQSALKQFEKLQNQEWQKIPVTTKKIKIGDSDSSLFNIEKRLTSLGFADSSSIQNNSKRVYDSLLAEKVKIFQRANGLIDDGVIIKSTIEKLNAAPIEYIDKIKINLERLRWIDYSDTARYILVNIPDFKLHMMENGDEIFNINVCTGRKRFANFEKQYLAYKKSKYWRNKPEDWETPILYGKISHLILNPTWTVPSSIMREEIASKVRRDSTYLKRANFKVYKNGSQIDPAELKVSELSSGSIPYTIIQDPGAGNALGKIKFMFDNPFGVYLHDTPTRAPFKYENRAVSHGCVRVEKPLQLAEYILNNNSKWTIDYLKIEIGTKINNKSVVEEFKQKRSELRKGSSYGSTTDVKLDKPIPLFIDYFTAWVDKNGYVNFRSDVYRQDKIIMDQLLK